jgi:hypothetical protein
MGITLKMVDYLLPIGREDVFVVSVKTLVDLGAISVLCPNVRSLQMFLHWPMLQYKTPQQVRNLVGQAISTSVPCR